MAIKLRGHSTIELTNVKTGEKEHYEHDNLITNAVPNMINLWQLMGGKSIVNGRILPLISRAMGGIYLFDNTLTENVNNMYLPDASEAKLTGYAGHITSAGEDNMRGDFNAEESGTITNGYKFVWDFGTNDANGDIAALALTHDLAGYHGYKYDTYLMRSAAANTGSTPTNYRGFGASNAFGASTPPQTMKRTAKFGEDANGYYVICVYFTSTTNLQIVKYRLKTNNIGLNENNFGEWYTESSQNIPVSDSALSSSPNYDTFQFIDGGDGYYYGIACQGNNNSTFKMCKLKIDTNEYTPVVTHTYSNLYICDINMQLNYGSGHMAAIRNGYIYCAKQIASNSGGVTYDILKINIANLSEYTILASNLVARGWPRFYIDTNGTINCGAKLITLEDELIDNGAYDNGSNSSMIQYFEYGVNGLKMCGYEYRYNSYYYGSYEYLPNLQYLATINNLDTPVTKTAAKTMKITYTLTYAEE